MQLNINTDAAVIFANKLERISSRELVYAIKTALNSAAFDVKKNTMPAQAKQKFVQRNPNFFKANSRVEKASGNTIDSVKSIVGFIPTSLKGSNNFAVKDLEQQEEGGTIRGKSFIPTKRARISGSSNKQVSARNRISSIKKIIDVRTLRASNKRQAFRQAATIAGAGGNVLSGGILWRINSLAKRYIKATAIYSYKKSRSVKVSSTGFMKTSALQSGSRIEEYFIQAARRILNK